MWKGSFRAQDVRMIASCARPEMGMVTMRQGRARVGNEMKGKWVS